MRYLVVGAAGHAQEVGWSLREQERAHGRDCELLFFDDAVPCGPLASGLGAVVGRVDDVAAHARGDRGVVLGIGLPRTKAGVIRRLASQVGDRWTTVVHPGATIGPNVELGPGCYVGAGAILTVNVRIAAFATVNLQCQVAHDSVVEELATLHPGSRLSGGVRIGTGSEIGAGAVVTPGVTIGEWARLGAGCVAVRSLTGGRTYVGVPARALPESGERSFRPREITA
jgi:sugar O-acyltransferase (sialic acid O-acetyltransferase NeuD family)